MEIYPIFLLLFLAAEAFWSWALRAYTDPVTALSPALALEPSWLTPQGDVAAPGGLRVCVSSDTRWHLSVCCAVNTLAYDCVRLCGHVFCLCAHAPLLHQLTTRAWVYLWTRYPLHWSVCVSLYKLSWLLCFTVNLTVREF